MYIIPKQWFSYFLNVNEDVDKIHINKKESLVFEHRQYFHYRDRRRNSHCFHETDKSNRLCYVS